MALLLPGVTDAESECIFDYTCVAGILSQKAPGIVDKPILPQKPGKCVSTLPSLSTNA